MATYQFDGPDGTYQFEAPDDAHPDDIERHKQQLIQQIIAEQNKPKPDPIVEKKNTFLESIQSGLSRFGAGVVDPYVGLAQIAAHSPGVDPANTQRADKIAREHLGEPVDGIDWARTAGNVVGSLPFALGGGGPVAVGAASSAFMPEEDFSIGNKVADTVLGGILGKILNPAVSASPELQMLRDAGVRTTVGQAVKGADGLLPYVLNRWEQMASSLPVVGDAAKYARRTAVEDFNKAALNKAAKNIGGEVPDIGNLGLQELDGLVREAYGNAAEVMDTPFSTSPELLRLFGDTPRHSKLLTDANKQRFDILTKDAFSFAENKTGITAENFKRIDSELGQHAYRYSKSPYPTDQELGNAIRSFQDNLRYAMSSLNPESASLMGSADKAFRDMKGIEKATKAARGTDGVFTPNQLNRYTEGNERLNPLARAGNKILSDNVPNSGTTDRLLFDLAATGGVHAISPATAVGIALTGGLATPTAQKGILGWILQNSKPSVLKQIQSVLPLTSGAFNREIER